MSSPPPTPRDIRKLCEVLWLEPPRVSRNPEGFFFRKVGGPRNFRCDRAANAAIAEKSAYLNEYDQLRLTEEGKQRYPKPW